MALLAQSQDKQLTEANEKVQYLLYKSMTALLLLCPCHIVGVRHSLSAPLHADIICLLVYMLGARGVFEKTSVITVQKLNPHQWRACAGAAAERRAGEDAGGGEGRHPHHERRAAGAARAAGLP